MTMENIWLPKQDPFHWSIPAFSEIADEFESKLLDFIKG